MKSMQTIKGAMMCLAWWGLCQTAQAAPTVVDVALREGGVLAGQVVTPQGTPVEGVTVALRCQSQPWVTTKTGKDGAFRFVGLRGGVYQLASSQGHGIYRAWMPGTAPPAAHETALLVVSTPLARGQNDPRYYEPNEHPRLRRFLTSPLVVAGAITTAVAVPVAIHNAEEDEPASP
jgi:hypothetical protein